MTGSSMIVINPPHGLAEMLREVLPFLKDALAQFDGASFALDTR
jgi:23S rRNA (adenine2030-N6)-methyltransferase